MTFLPLYIDPGTGSMLFSILIGACATLFFLAKAFWLKLKLFFTGGKGQKLDKAYKKYVIYSEDKRYWNIFKPVLDAFENRKIEITYYVANDKDPVFEEKYEFVKPEVIAPGRHILSLCNEDNRYVYKSGTSMSTPIVSGAVALALEKKPQLSPKAVKVALYRSCTPLRQENNKSWGMINVDKFIKMV